MNYYGESLSKLIEHFSRLPGIGGKTAQRLAFHVLNMPKEDVEAFASSLLSAKTDVKYCSICCNLTDNDPCEVCSDHSRRKDIIMVVENPRDMASYERSKGFDGRYHILHGLIAVTKGIGPDDIKIRELVRRIDENIKEVVIALSPTIDGDITAAYIAKTLKPLGVKVTKIANGVPIGSDLEYIDEITLAKALEGRSEMIV